MIKIKESELRRLISEHVREELNEYYIYDSWNKLGEFTLTEGLTMTYSINKITEILEQKYKLKEKGITCSWVDGNRMSNNMFAAFKMNTKTTRETDNWYFFSLYFSKGVQGYSNMVSDIVHTCDACGWFLSDVTYFTREGFEQKISLKNNKAFSLNDENLINCPIKLIFRAKFNAEYKPKSVPAFLYHICPTRVVDRILRQGLTPRNNGRIASHPERVYLFIERNNDWEDIASQFRISGNDEPYSYLRVDTREINPQIHFYYDSNVMQGNPAIYTLEPIPPTTIKVIDNQEK